MTAPRKAPAPCAIDKPQGAAVSGPWGLVFSRNGLILLVAYFLRGFDHG